MPLTPPADGTYHWEVDWLLPLLNALSDGKEAAGLSGTTQSALNALYEPAGLSAATKATLSSGGGSTGRSVSVVGLVGDGVTDDGPVIQAVLDSLATSSSTHAVELVVEAPTAGGSVFINSIVQIQTSNVSLRFRSPVIYGATGRVRIMGSLAETPATGKPVTTTSAAAGDTILVVSNASYFSTGSFIVVRSKDAAGNTIEKETARVAAVNSSTLTLVDGLENSYPAGSQVTVVVASALLAGANRGDRSVNVTSTAGFSPGDIVAILDDTHTTTPAGAIEPNNYKHRELAEVKQIVSPTVLRLSHALHHAYDTSAFARVARVVPVKNSFIRDAQVTYSAMSTVNNAFEIQYGVKSAIERCSVTGDPVNGRSWKSQAFRQTDSLWCRVSDCSASDPADTSSARGYGATLYGATYCIVERSKFSSCRHSVLLFNGASGNLVTGCHSEDCCVSDFDLHGAECVDNLITSNVVVGGDSVSTDGVAGRTACKVGNTSHIDGDYHNVFSNMLIVNYQGAAFEAVVQSTDNAFRDSRVNGALTGVKLRYLTANPSLTVAATTVSNIEFADVGTPLDIDGGSNQSVMNVVLDNLTWTRITAGGGLVVKNAMRVRVRFQAIRDSALQPGAYAFTGSNVLDLTVKRNDFSGLPRGIKATNCPGARFADNYLHDLYDSVAWEDGGGNTGFLFRGNDTVGFTPTSTVTSGAVPSTGTLALTPGALGGALYVVDNPNLHGWVEWNFDPAVLTSTTTTATSGTRYLQRVRAINGGTVNNILTYVSTAGATLTSGQCLAALYDSAGNLLATSADQSTAWTTTGLKVMALGNSVNLTIGADYFVALLAVGTTPPAFARGASSVVVKNSGVTNAQDWYGVNGTTQTTMPATLTLSSTSGTGASAWWVALS